MGIEQIYTTQIAGVKGPGGQGGQALSAGGLKGVLASGNFFDLFLANLAEVNEAQKDKVQNVIEQVSQEKGLSDDVSMLDEAAVSGVLDETLASGVFDETLDIADLIAEDTEAAEDVFVKTSTQTDTPVDESDINQALSINALIAQNILKPMHEQCDLPKDEESLEIVFKNLENLLEKIQVRSEDGDDLKGNAKAHGLEVAVKMLINNQNRKNDVLELNLTPAEMSELLPSDVQLTNMDDIAAQLNTMDVGGAAQIGAVEVSGAAQMTESMDTRYAGGKKISAKDFYKSLEAVLKAENGQMIDTESGLKTKLQTANTKLDGQQNPITYFMGADDMFVAADFNGLFAGLIDGLPQGQATPDTGLSALSNLTSHVSHTAHAGSAHPATQMVAMQVQKVAGQGQDKTFTIQLDPPDLGRVEVSMQFSSKGKTMKAVLTVEKPETYMMLQRDSHTLEKTLQEMGLDADSGVSFELADQGHDFMGGNRRGGAHDHSGATGSGQGDDYGAVDTDAIETSLLWMIDPETGHARYDFWV